MPDLRAKRPQLKSDAFKDLRQWMLDMWEYVNGLTQVSGDGHRVLVSQSKDGTVIKLQEDDYKKQFPFYVESLSGGHYSETSTFNIKGGMVATANAQFKFSEQTKFTITKKYVYISVFNSDADTAEEIPVDGTQQNISDDATGLYAKVSESESELTPIEGNTLNILLGTQLGGVFFQRHIGDIYIYGSSQASESKAWQAFYETGVNETWAVPADETYPEIIPSLQYTIEGEIINSNGSTKTGEITPLEQTIAAGTVLWFYVKLSNLDASQVSWSIETDTNEPDVDTAPEGEKWVVLYNIEGIEDTYVLDGSNRSGTKFIITQINEGPIDLREPGAGVKLYRVTSANYSGDPENESIYTVQEVEDYTYTDSTTPGPDDFPAKVSAEGFPFGLVVGKVYESFKDLGGVPLLKAPETFTLKHDGGWKLMDSHFGNELKTLSNVEVLSLPTIELEKFVGIYFDARWDSLRNKLTVYIPTM